MAGSSAADADAHFQTGVAALRAGDPAAAEAAFRAVLDITPDHAPALYNLGVVVFQRGDSAAAEPLLRQADQARPHHADTLSVLAAVQLDLNNRDAALATARRILNCADADAPALHTAAQVFAQAGHTTEAETISRKALTQDPSYRPAALTLASLLSLRRAFDEAAAVCTQALQHRPADADLHLKRAQALWDGGQPAPAKTALLNLLDLAPDHVTALYNLSLYADVPERAAAIARLQSLVGEEELDPEDTAKAWFALGNHHAAAHDWQEALACFTAGNAARAAQATALHARSNVQFDKRVAALLAQPLPRSETPPAPDATPSPLILCGPSRSGKSLLQSWLSAHPDVAAADEVGLLSRLAETDCLASDASRATAAHAYRDTLRALGGEGRFVIDTHPTNALYLDLLLALCPDARVIFVERDPLDAAVSIFARHFVTGGHWADTWEGIAARLTAYRKLAEHWRAHPAVLEQVAVEDAIAAPGQTLARVSTQLGLTWDDKLTPAIASPDTETPMPWASFNDRPAARLDTIGLWRPFAPWLGGFADAYGREHLAAAQDIPSAPATAESTADLQNVPGTHRRRADEFERTGDFASALDARWAAVSCRPFTRFVRDHAERLSDTLSRAPDHAAVSRLHAEVDTLWQTYRAQSRLRFGDYGLLYQSYAPAFLPGSRDTASRAAAYHLTDLASGARVLDLGCNTGFLALTAAATAREVVGVDHAAPLIAIAEAVCAFSGFTTCRFATADAATFSDPEPFDLVIAAAVHGWIDLPLPDLSRRLAALTAPGGAVLFESQGQRSTEHAETDFGAKVTTLCDAGFSVERRGQVCDDGVNLRAFVVLRRSS